MWETFKCETALVPKDEAMSIMTSRTMMSQEFGWGFELSLEQLSIVKEKRAGKNYEDMVMQLEDYIDCLKVAYPGIDLVSLLNHSCGHEQ
jgi:hypothetical protein